MSTTDPNLKPEQRARVRIDAQLKAAGWKVVNYKDADFLSDEAQAIREFPLPTGSADYLLLVDGKATGTVEAKKEGGANFAVETQADRYADGFEQLVKTKDLERYADRLPFHYIADGTTTLFTSRKDPIRRPRQVFYFHRAETLKDWALEEHSLRARLRQMPVLNEDGMRLIQPVAVKGLEQSLRDDRPRALIGMTMGAGKTYVAAAETYRLLRFGGAKRVLFLVDRITLGKQARDEMVAYVSPDDQRRFGDDFVIQLLSSKDPKIRESSNVVITTIQRLYAALRDTSAAEVDDEAFDESSSFEQRADGPPIEVSYQPKVPIETFDFVWIDECHRSIYGRWGQVLDYFDAFQLGLTATPTATTIGYFNENLIADYDHDQSVADGVNVDQQLYRIDTKVGTGGAEIGAGNWVQVRDKVSKKVDPKELDDDFGYDAKQLDYAVVNPSHIRTVIKTFRDRVRTEIFPGRDAVPKTVFFCKTDHFLFHTVLSPGFYAAVMQKARGVSYPAVRDADVLSIEVAVPGTSEQRRSAQRVTNILAQVQRGVLSLATARTDLVSFRASVLASAVTGELVENTFEGLSGPELLDELLAAREARTIENGLSRHKPAREPTAPPARELPHGWTWATIDQLMVGMQYGSSAKTIDEVAVPVLRMGNILDGRVVLDALKYLPSDHDEFPDLFLKDGDLLFNRTNSPELVGKTAIARQLPEPCSLASYLIRVRLADEVVPEFVSYFINSPYGREWASAQASQQVGQANLNGTKLRALVLPLPPRTVQTRIVARVESLLMAARDQRRRFDSDLRHAGQLKTAVLGAGMRGELCHSPDQGQDVEDSALVVERARQQRTVMESELRARKKAARQRRSAATRA